MRNNEITNIRAIGTIMVLLGHCLYAFAGLDWVFNVPYSEMASGLTRYIYSFHMGLFFVVSGLLFQKVYVKRIAKVNAFTFVRRRFVRLIFPLITVKFLICNPVNIYIGRYNPWNCKSFFIELGHLWFLLTLFVISSGLYIVMYNLKLNRIGGGYSFDFTLILISFVLMMISENIPNFGISAINSIFYYQMFFITGIMIEKYNLLRFIRKKCIFITSVFIHALLFTYVFCTDIQCGTFLKSIIAFLGCFAWTGIATNVRKNKVLSFIDKYGMGIYLFHFPIIYLMLDYLGQFNVSVSISITMLVVLSLISSIVLTNIVRKLHIEFLIGESQ